MKTGNQLSSRDDMWCTKLSSSGGTEIDAPLDLRRRESLEFPKGRQATVVYDVERGIAREPKQRKWASSRVDLGYTKNFAFLS